MLLDDLYKHYGNWTKLSRELDLGSTSYRPWKKHGYIPYRSQVYIENKTNGLFKADLAHAIPPKNHHEMLLARY